MGCNINGCNMNRVFAMRALQTQLSIDFISVELTTERIMVGIAKIEVRRNHLPHSPAAGRLVHRDEIHMALLQLWEDSFVAGRCPTCDDHVHSARSVHSGKMMSFDNPLKVVRTETLTTTTRTMETR